MSDWTLGARAGAKALLLGGAALATFSSSDAHAGCIINGIEIFNSCKRVATGANSHGEQAFHESFEGDNISETSLHVGFADFSGEAKANVLDGTLKAFINSGMGGGAQAAWQEAVKFDLPDGVDSVDIPIKVRLEGMNIEGLTPSYNNIGMGFQAASYLLPGADPSHFSVFGVTKYCGFDSDFTNAICKDGPVSIEYNGVLTIWEDVYYSFAFAIQVGGSDMIQDFGHTARFSWDLPSDVSFASSSGLFMSAAPTPAVPEPSTWALMLAGFGAVGCAMRRRSVRVAFG